MGLKRTIENRTWLGRSASVFPSIVTGASRRRTSAPAPRNLLALIRTPSRLGSPHSGDPLVVQLMVYIFTMKGKGVGPLLDSSKDEKISHLPFIHNQYIYIKSGQRSESIVESPRGISPLGSHSSGREPLNSSGSYCPAGGRIPSICQCANNWELRKARRPSQYVAFR